ncbi:K+-transporting ATPase, A chain [Candidatus Scalindua japonica]|uniref:K+-transporting ATPase, A chain n=1 Tax=Candidatus Scalindua japonica TaxID=1284222 RepID=A0A286TY61_9BACT|nr:K+-transporting ATPase, A chain [Candidatus Scalindua japonica]
MRNLDATNGIRVNATNNEETNAEHIDTPKSCIKTPILDFERNTSGIKTHMVVAVAAMIATPTSLLPKTAASLKLRHLSCLCLKMFSRTTTAGSTIIPIASINPVSEIMFRVTPEPTNLLIRNIRQNVHNTEIGIAAVINNALLTL